LRNAALERRVSVPQEMPADSVQMQLVRRYSRILREKQAQYRGPRIGAKERRLAAREVAEDAASRALAAVQPPDAHAT
jgi:hypothetical protein